MVTWPFLLTSLVVVATPGTGAVYTLNAGLVRGRRAAAWAALACTLGILPHLLAAISGLAAVLHAGSAAYGVLVWAGVAYLLHLARGTWRSATTADVFPGSSHRGRAAAGAASPTAGRVLRDGVVLNLLNPKLTLFFFAFLPPFLTIAEPVRAAVQMSLLGAVFMGLTWLVFTGYGVSAALLRPTLVRRPELLVRATRGFAVCYVLLALGLAVQHLR